MVQFLVLVVLAVHLSDGARKTANAPASSGLDSSGASDEQGRASSGTRVSINPGATVQGVVNANPAGTTFVLQAGVFRMQSVTPKVGDTFEGQPGAILNGSRQLTSFTRSGIYWIAGSQTQHGTANGRC